MFAHGKFLTVPWNQGCSRSQTIRATISNVSWFSAISRWRSHMATTSPMPASLNGRRPRDNVVFELGLSMGRLGRKRGILMEPRGEGVKLPSDMAA
ncbi:MULTISPECIES: TIR domain-containing protein [Paraburkholderia]|uniref:TIR domain-containing protein n=1 Tax=Paraburkholderia TaxID=1822464 RepID=UPI0034D322F7